MSHRIRIVAAFVIGLNGPLEAANSSNRDSGKFDCAGSIAELLGGDPSPTKEKTYPFGDVDPDAQANFLSTLQPIVVLADRPVQDQCENQCGPFAVARYFSHFLPDGSATISGGYFTARAIATKFRNSLHKGQPFHISTDFYTEKLVLKEFGVLTDEQYPSRADVNIQEVHAVLNTLLNDSKTDRAADTDAVYELAVDIIQYYFGPFPEDSIEEGTELLAELIPGKELLNFPGKLRGEHLKQHVESELRKNRPVLITYEVREKTHAGDGVFAQPKPKKSPPTHLANITGIYEGKDQKIYYKISNTHRNAPVFLLEGSYLDEHLFYLVQLIHSTWTEPPGSDSKNVIIEPDNSKQ